MPAFHHLASAKTRRNSTTSKSLLKLMISKLTLLNEPRHSDKYHIDLCHKNTTIDQPESVLGFASTSLGLSHPGNVTFCVTLQVHEQIYIAIIHSFARVFDRAN